LVCVFSTHLGFPPSVAFLSGSDYNPQEIRHWLRRGVIISFCWLVLVFSRSRPQWAPRPKTPISILSQVNRVCTLVGRYRNTSRLGQIDAPRDQGPHARFTFGGVPRRTRYEAWRKGGSVLTGRPNLLKGPIESCRRCFSRTWEKAGGVPEYHSLNKAPGKALRTQSFEKK